MDILFKKCTEKRVKTYKISLPISRIYLWDMVMAGMELCKRVILLRCFPHLFAVTPALAEYFEYGCILCFPLASLSREKLASPVKAFDSISFEVRHSCKECSLGAHKLLIGEILLSAMLCDATENNINASNIEKKLFTYKMGYYNS